MVGDLPLNNTHGLDFECQMLRIVDGFLSEIHEFSNLSLMIQLTEVNLALQL
jgi:hypothetical protein